MLTSLVDLKQRMSDDHNIYHYKSGSKRKHTVFERKKRKEYSDKLRSSIRSATHMRRLNSRVSDSQSFFDVQSPPKMEVGRRQCKLSETSNINLDNAISAGMNYGLISSSQLKLLNTNSHSRLPQPPSQPKRA